MCQSIVTNVLFREKIRNNVLLCILNIIKKITRQVERKENDRTEKNPIARRTTVEESTKVGNKDKRSKFKDGTMDNEQVEGYINVGKKNIAKPGDIVDSSQ